MDMKPDLILFPSYVKIYFNNWLKLCFYVVLSFGVVSEDWIPGTIIADKQFSFWLIKLDSTNEQGKWDRVK